MCWKSTITYRRWGVTSAARNMSISDNPWHQRNKRFSVRTTPTGNTNISNLFLNGSIRSLCFLCETPELQTASTEALNTSWKCCSSDQILPTSPQRANIWHFLKLRPSMNAIKIQSAQSWRTTGFVSSDSENHRTAGEAWVKENKIKTGPNFQFYSLDKNTWLQLPSHFISSHYAPQASLLNPSSLSPSQTHTAQSVPTFRYNLSWVWQEEAMICKIFLFRQSTARHPSQTKWIPAASLVLTNSVISCL